MRILDTIETCWHSEDPTPLKLAMEDKWSYAKSNFENASALVKVAGIALTVVAIYLSPMTAGAVLLTTFVFSDDISEMLNPLLDKVQELWRSMSPSAQFVAVAATGAAALVVSFAIPTVVFSATVAGVVGLSLGQAPSALASRLYDNGFNFITSSINSVFRQNYPH